MFQSYFDESGLDSRSRILTVSGVVSPARQWDRLCIAWERLLRKERLEYFHASDLWNGKAEFDRWAEDQEGREALYGKFVEIATRHVDWRIWCAMLLQKYLGAIKEKSKKRAYFLAYTVCAFSAMDLLEDLARELGTKFPIMFDQGGRGGPFARQAISKLLTEQHAGHHRATTAISDGNKKCIIPLQVADLHAYEVYRYFDDQHRRLPLRPSFKKLLRIPQAAGGGYFYEQRNLLTLLETLKERFSNPNVRMGKIRLMSLDSTHRIIFRPDGCS